MNDKESQTRSVALMYKEINAELQDKNVQRALLQTVFKGLSAEAMPKAIYEGMMRGFKFRDFLEKNVYAIPFKDGYSLVTSIDYARKIGMRSGVVGKAAPQFTYDDTGKVESCSITIKRRVGQDIGEYTSTVYFVEYYRAGKNGYPSLWDSKPRTMIAKVAEMHALRMACPEEMSQLYSEEELDKEKDNADFDREGIDDDTPVTSTGDDDGSDAPRTEADKPNLILEQNNRNKGKAVEEPTISLDEI